MEPDYGSCDVCNKGRLELKEKKQAGGSNYNMLICSQCRHQIARRVE